MQLPYLLKNNSFFALDGAQFKFISLSPTSKARAKSKLDGHNQGLIEFYTGILGGEPTDQEVVDQILTGSHATVWRNDSQLRRELSEAVARWQPV